MENIKYKVIYFWLVHIFLPRIGKRHPELFKQWIDDCVEKPRDRKILMLRYTTNPRMTFTAIAAELNVDESNLFKYHKRAVDCIISA